MKRPYFLPLLLLLVYEWGAAPACQPTPFSPPWQTPFASIIDEYAYHLLSFKQDSVTGHPRDRFDTTYNLNLAFVTYAREHLLERPGDSVFIANRNLLPDLCMVACEDHFVRILDTLQSGKRCELTLRTAAFRPQEHVVIRDTVHNWNRSIDGLYPFSGVYELPRVAIQDLRISLNGQPLDIPQTAYQNLYNLNLCEQAGSFHRPVALYESLNGEYLYLYLYGGNAAGTYFAKLVFDHQGYVTRMVVDYVPLSQHSSFRRSFLGF